MKTLKKIKFDKKSIYYLMHQLYDIILSSPKGIIEQFSVNVLLFLLLIARVSNVTMQKVLRTNYKINIISLSRKFLQSFNGKMNSIVRNVLIL